MQGIDTEPWNTKTLIADKTTEPDYHMKRIYYNAVGGNADFESLRYKLIMYGQYFGLVFDPVFSGKRTVTAKATALAAVKVFTKDPAGKRQKDIDVGLAKK